MAAIVPRMIKKSVINHTPRTPYLLWVQIRITKRGNTPTVVKAVPEALAAWLLFPRYTKTACMEHDEHQVHASREHKKSRYDTRVI